MGREAQLVQKIGEYLFFDPNYYSVRLRKGGGFLSYRFFVWAPIFSMLDC
jgi:hypothetical protein